MHRKHTKVNNDPRGKKNNIDTIWRIMSEKKTTLPSLRNQDLRTVKSETEKVNDLLTNIPTNDIIELNDLTIRWSKISLWKNQFPREDDRQKVKTRVETPIWIDASIQWLEDCIKTCGERNNRNNTDNTRANGTTITIKKKLEEKQLHWRFKRLISNISHEKTWTWLRKKNLKRQLNIS